MFGSIAKKIQKKANGDVNKIYKFCEKSYEDIDQNYKKESTTYTFSDGSKITYDSSGNIRVH